MQRFKNNLSHFPVYHKKKQLSFQYTVEYNPFDEIPDLRFLSKPTINPSPLS